MNNESVTVDKEAFIVPTRIKGVDVSRYQPGTDWEAVKAGGNDFCFIKATEGVGVINPLFKHDWEASRAAGMIRGAYHFFRPQHDGRTQANHFLQQVGGLFPVDLPCVLDIEVMDGVSADGVRFSIMNFLNQVQSVTKKVPIIYGSPSFLGALQLDASFAGYPLWVANYGVDAPHIPKPWATWTFWQHTSSGQTGGINGNADLSFFKGTLSDLQAFAMKSI